MATSRGSTSDVDPSNHLSRWLLSRSPVLLALFLLLSLNPSNLDRSHWPLPAAHAQQAFNQNITAISGTWSSGSGNVVTGPGFCNPLNSTFNPPATTGISLSFTDDLHFEEAQYRFTSNGSEPHCITAYLIYQHGTYTFEPNGSITTQPIAADGRIQVQDPCAAASSIITYYYEPGLYQNWFINNDVNHNQYMLQLTQFDGSYMPRMYLAFRPPQMLTTDQITTNASAKSSAIANGQSLAQSGAKALWAPALATLGLNVVLLIALRP